MIFTIGAQQYAITVHAVVEVVHLPALTALHGAPPYICGLLNWHGRHLAVLDGRALVGEPPACTLSSQVLLIGAPSAEAATLPRLGLLVDQVRGVQALAGAAVTGLPSELAAPLLAAVMQGQGGSSTIIFDVSALLALAPGLGQSYGPEHHRGTPHTH